MYTDITTKQNHQIAFKNLTLMHHFRATLNPSRHLTPTPLEKKKEYLHGFSVVSQAGNIFKQTETLSQTKTEKTPRRFLYHKLEQEQALYRKLELGSILNVAWLSFKFQQQMFRSVLPSGNGGLTVYLIGITPGVTSTVVLVRSGKATSRGGSLTA